MMIDEDELVAVQKRNGRWTLANAIISLFLLLMLGWMTWITNSTVDLREFAARGDRFTTTDGEALRQEIRREIKDLEIPPRWFLEEVRDHGKYLREIEKRLSALENGKR